MANQLDVVKRLAMLCTLFVALGCATAQIQAREFQVVDIAFTPPRPIAGASILAVYEYQATIPGHSATYCSGVEFTHAGPDGRFTLTGEGSVHINAHQVGFSRPSKGLVMSKGQVFLKSDGSPEERLKHLSSLISGSACLGRNRNPVIADFLETALPDLHELSGTTDGQQLVADFQRRIKALRTESR